MQINFTPFEKTFLSIGPISLKYYGLMYAIGAIFVYWVSKKIFQKDKIKITNEELLDLLTYGIFGVILGGRLGYILFYNFNYYLTNPLKIFAVWEGGMSFHGGLLGVIITTLFYCHKNRFSFYQLADVAIIPVFIALALGRFGNFINGELVGRITDVPWAIKFEKYEGLRHPSQLYEFGKNLLIFSFLLFLRKFKFRQGTIFWSGIMFYGLFRFLIEFTRQPDVQIGFIFQSLTMGQLLSFPMFVIGAGMIWKLNYKK